MDEQPSEQVIRFRRYVRAAQAYIWSLSVESHRFEIVEEYYEAREALAVHGDVPDIDVPITQARR